MAANPYRNQPENASYESAWDLGHAYGVAYPDQESPDAPHVYPPLDLDEQQTAWMDQVWQEGALAGRGDASAATPGGSGLAATGAQPDQVPAEFAAGGLPSFHYKLPDIPVAQAEIETPEAHFEVKLSIVGEVNVTFHDAVKSVQVGNEGMKVAAGHALGPLSDGIAIDHLGTSEPSIVLSVASRFSTLEAEAVPGRNAIKFKGTSEIQYSIETDTCGPVEVEGAPGWELEIECTPHPQGEPEPVPETEESWVSQHSGALTAIGVLVLIGIGIALAPETGGGSLILVAAAG